MEVEFQDGRKVEVEDEDQARREIESQYPDAVYNDDWDQTQSGERLLVWEDQASMDGPSGHGDDGSNAIAEIIRSD